jgi:N utilization substance protein B
MVTPTVKSHQYLRTKSRGLALQVLYHLDVAGHLESSLIDQPNRFVHLTEAHFKHFDVQPKIQPFAQKLVVGTCVHRKEIDLKLTQVIEHWKLDRVSVIDRAILRMAAFEMKNPEETHPSIIINEAIELTKQFSATESGAFINAILEKLKKMDPTQPLAASG